MGAVHGWQLPFVALLMAHSKSNPGMVKPPPGTALTRSRGDREGNEALQCSVTWFVLCTFTYVVYTFLCTLPIQPQPGALQAVLG